MISFTQFILEASPAALAKLKQLRDKANPKQRKLVTHKELNDLEKSLDALFKHLNIDIEFSGHFFDRLRDARNGRDITIEELNDLFVAVHKKFGTTLSHEPDAFQAVMKSISSKINVPFIIRLNKNGMIELISKTIMRKANFKTPDAEMKV